MRNNKALIAHLSMFGACAFWGLGILKPSHALAVILVFTGVWLVTKSRSRQDMEQTGASKDCV